MRQVIQQGHKYMHLQLAKPVIVLEVLPFFARVGVMALPDQPWFHRIEEADFEDLRPMPMKYFGGEVPRADQA